MTDALTHNELIKIESYIRTKIEISGDFIDNVRAEWLLMLLPAAKQALDAGWRPISDAPKDGTRVVGWSSEGVEVMWWEDAFPDGPDQPGHDAGWIGYCYTFPGRNKDDRFFSEPQGQPTHFQHLPTPPEGA